MTFIFLFERRNGEKTHYNHCYFTLIYFVHWFVNIVRPLIPRRWCIGKFIETTIKLVLHAIHTVRPFLNRSGNLNPLFLPYISRKNFFFLILEDISPICGATDRPILDFWWPLLWVTVGSLIHIHIPWGPPLVQQLLTYWQPAWQSSHSLPNTCKQALVGIETGIYHTTAALQCETSQTPYRLSSG